MLRQQNKIQWVYNSRSNAELTEKYDEWAKDYDHDLLEDFGYAGPQSAARTFSKHVPKGAKILDAGAGTGLVGRELSRLGYVDMEAMDISRGMLDEARRKNVYGKLHEMVMGEPLDFPSDYFDSTICVGTFTVGHAPANSLEELVRVTRPGGYIVFTLRPDILVADGFKEKQDSLVTSSKWNLVEISEAYKVLPKGEPDLDHQVWVYRVN